MTLLEKGRPQKVQLDQFLNDDYFEKYGEVPLPPYIQKARKERHNVASDESWYQTAWAKKEGSFAEQGRTYQGNRTSRKRGSCDS
jgi:S-adenosylmethionine:tRNA ribosyltransferase-isomerase